MRKTNSIEGRILKALKENEGGRPMTDICRELDIHHMTFNRWKKVYSGMDSTQMAELKALREENQKLKTMYADMALVNKVLKDVLSKKF